MKPRRPKTHDRPGYRSEEHYRRELDRTVGRETRNEVAEHFYEALSNLTLESDV